MRTTTALVLGAGPAGAVAAAALARRGVPTVLAGRGETGRDHEVLLGGPARRGLRSIGFPASWHGSYPVELWLGAENPCPLPDVDFATVSGARLRADLRTHAVASGAEYLEGEVTSLTAGSTGFSAVLDGHLVVEAAQVVVATGAPVAGAAGHGTGVACARSFTGPLTGDRVILRLLAPPGADPAGRPRCVWLAPSADGYTIGAAAIGRCEDPARFLAEAIAALGEVEPRLVEGTPRGPIDSAPVYSGFSPGRAAGDGGLLVGDAAGLVNPFTGEGLSGAVHSGLLAAGAIASHVDDRVAARRTYERDLGAAFVGYFETANHAARRYHLAWRVLAAGAGSESPFFVKGRRAIVLPEGLSEPVAGPPLRPPPGTGPILAPFLAACDEVAVTTIRREWPFLARLFTPDRSLTDFRLRPAVALCAAILAGGGTPRRGHPTVAAAIELAMLGALAFLGPAVTPRARRGVDWESATTILGGDYLLGRASRLIAETAPGLSWSFADWLGELTALRAEVVVSPETADVARVFASLFEFPLRVGAELGAATAESARTLRRYGDAVGRLFLFAEDALALGGKRTRLDTTLGGMLAARTSTVPGLLRRHDLTADTLGSDPLLRAAALAVVLDRGRRAWREARAAGARLSDSRARRVLRVFADAIAEPAFGSLPSP
ncbi:hypothetical protein [Amycolatopsis samaneae]|uniref:Dehydrogenase (Flavoprotein) n=1 Tax=Amycolatopsis samaneae TaxID=664691 RepID=A0ABW5G7X9_9PSEU